MTGPELERRIRMTGLTFAQFAKLVPVSQSALYAWRREMQRPGVAVTARVQTLLETLERQRLAELLEMYPQKETEGASPRRRT